MTRDDLTTDEDVRRNTHSVERSRKAVTPPDPTETQSVMWVCPVCTRAFHDDEHYHAGHGKVNCIPYMRRGGERQMKPLICFLFGHKFVYVPAYGSEWRSDFCLRCGLPARQPGEGTPDE